MSPITRIVLGGILTFHALSVLDHSYGWFVGWVVKGGQTILFVRLVQDDRRTPVNAGLRVKDAFLQELPVMLRTLGR